MKRRSLRAIAALAAMAAVAWQVHAQQPYPDRPLRMLVGQSPGSATDTVARLMAAKMEKALGQPIVVENRAGAGGVVAAGGMAKSKPDGYAILMTTASQTSLAPNLMENVPYDPFRDFTYIAPGVDVAMLLVASRKSGIDRFSTLQEKARSMPGKIDFGSSGLGSASHLALEMVARQAGIALSHVPYKGSAPAIASVVSGETSLHVNALGNLAPLVRAGEVIPIALLTQERSPLLPDVPSLADLGMSGVPRIPAWIGLIGPAGMPPEVVGKLAGAMQAARADPEVRQSFAGQGFLAFTGSGEEFKQRAQQDGEVWGKLIRDLALRN